VTPAPPVRSLETRARSLEEALALGPALLRKSQQDGAVWAAASVATGHAVVLGAAQRAGRVVDLEACSREGARVVRRISAGTAAYVNGRALVWTLALPSVASLMPDATARTLLNRNVRPFLRGLKGGGLAAQYFGREWIAVRHAPAALLGFDVARDGAVLLEVIAGFDAPIAIPGALAAPLERAIDRWRGKAPVALADLAATPRAPEDLARLALEAIAAQAGADFEETSIDLLDSSQPVVMVSNPLDPVPPDFTLSAPERVPIGWIEAAAGPSACAWVGGDVLAPAWVFDAIARSEASGEPPSPDLEDAPIEGATLGDLRAAVRRALAQ
jgi:hypothetical protein